jgi:methyltransferase (TIGR00027 family)
MKKGKQNSQLLNVLEKFLQILLYIPVQVIFVPFAIIGLLHGLYLELGKGKKLGVSYSAGQALQYRWIMHYFETRPDPLSVAFVKKLPCESHFGLWSLLGALIISQRLFGFTTSLGKLVEPGRETLNSAAGIRVLQFDRIMKKYVDEMEQIVLPGAGFDLLSLHFSEGKEVSVFELDQTATMHVKVGTLRKAGIKHDWITYIPVDYARESWVDKLIEAGFDRTKKTLFLWQSVSQFLEADLVKETLGMMADLCVDGSIIAQDFYSRTLMFDDASLAVKSQRRMMAKMGEPWKFGLDMSEEPKAEVASFLEECGLKMTACYQFGEKLDIEPFYCIVEAVRK